MRVLITALAIVLGATGAVLGLVVLSWGGMALGLSMFAGGLLFSMLAAGTGLPRPDVVPRPGEESEYIRGE